MDTKTAPPPAPEEKKAAPLPQQRLGSGVGRFGAFGMPAEKTANFKQIVKRMAAMLRRERYRHGGRLRPGRSSASRCT